MTKELLMFYKSGILTKSQCEANGSSVIWYHVALTGAYRAQTGSYWKVRASLGTNWGDRGTMYIEKINDDLISKGACEIADDTVEFTARKY
jgi:hypothetical protein